MKKNLVIFVPSIEGGGVEKNFFIISNFLANKFNNVYLVTAEKNISHLISKKIILINPKSNFWSKRGRLLKYFICLYLLLKINFKLKKFLIFSFQANTYCILFSKIFNQKIVSRSNSSSEGWSKNPIKKILYKIILNLADKVIVNSLDFKKELDTKFNLKTTCIYNPLNKNEIIKKSKYKNSFSFFEKKTKEIKIMTVGRFTDQKDHITFIKSLNILKIKNFNFKAVIMGRGINKNKINETIKKNKLSSFVKIIKFNNNPYKYLRYCDLFVLTSKFEGLPNVLLEAMTLKKFIISSRCPTGPREILNNGKYGFLFKVGDYKELAKKIIIYKKNQKKNNSMINLGYKNLDRFDYKKNLNKYYKLLNSYI